MWGPHIVRVTASTNIWFKSSSFWSSTAIIWSQNQKNRYVSLENKCCHCGKIKQAKEKKIIVYARREKDLWRAIAGEQECGDIRECETTVVKHRPLLMATISSSRRLKPSFDCLWKITQPWPIFSTIFLTMPAKNFDVQESTLISGDIFNVYSLPILVSLFAAAISQPESIFIQRNANQGSCPRQIFTFFPHPQLCSGKLTPEGWCVNDISV